MKVFGLYFKNFKNRKGRNLRKQYLKFKIQINSKQEKCDMCGLSFGAFNYYLPFQKYLGMTFEHIGHYEIKYEHIMSTSDGNMT